MTITRQLLQLDFPCRFEKARMPSKIREGKQKEMFPESGKGNSDITDYVKKVFYSAYSLRIRLILAKKTTPGIIMNPMISTLKTSVQLSPINAPLI